MFGVETLSSFASVSAFIRLFFTRSFISFPMWTLDMLRSYVRKMKLNAFSNSLKLLDYMNNIRNVRLFLLKAFEKGKLAFYWL